MQIKVYITRPERPGQEPIYEFLLTSHPQHPLSSQAAFEVVEIAASGQFLRDHAGRIFLSVPGLVPMDAKRFSEEHVSAAIASGLPFRGCLAR